MSLSRIGNFNFSFKKRKKRGKRKKNKEKYKILQKKILQFKPSINCLFFAGEGVGQNNEKQIHIK